MSDEIKDCRPVFPTTTEHGFNSGEPGMTIRQYAAIKLRVPDSGTDWLDEMIRKSMRNELAAQAMQALIPCAWDGGGDTNYIIDDEIRMGLHLRSYEHADAMLKAQES